MSSTIGENHSRLEPSHRRDFLWKVIARYDHYISATNQKAAFILGFCTVLFGVIGSSSDKLISPFEPTPWLHVSVAVLMFAIIASLIVSLWYTLKVVAPFLKTPSEPGGYHSKIFFGDVAAIGSPEKYALLVGALDETSLEEDLGKQTHVLAKGLTAKFNDLNTALRVLVFGTLPIMILYVALRVLNAALGG